jgi:hypothetical protein
MSGEWMMKDDFDRIDRLRAELARVRGERDQLFEGVVGYVAREIFQGDRHGAIKATALAMRRDLAITGDVATVLAEHDRLAAERKVT